MKMIVQKSQTILPWLLVLVLVILVLFSNENKYVEKPERAVVNGSSFVGACVESEQESISKFYEIGAQLGVDKLVHAYETMYGVHLGPKRHMPLNFLEIGLGCTMPYGPGKSLKLWRLFLTHPRTRISFVEFDAQCARKFSPPLVAHMFVGDQANFEFLDRVGFTAGPYDVIVDDGGHKRSHQINSFLGLWPYVKPNGGIYVIEDMYHSFLRGFDDTNKTAIDLVHTLIMLKNEADLLGRYPLSRADILLSDETFGKAVKTVAKTIQSINCYFRACVFVKS